MAYETANAHMWETVFIFLLFYCTWDLVVVHELLVVTCGIQFPDEGLNLGPLSQPLDHQGGPKGIDFYDMTVCLICSGKTLVLKNRKQMGKQMGKRRMKKLA